MMIPDTNAEVRFWEERTRTFVDILSVPWVLSKDEVEALRKEFIREEDREKKRKRERELKREKRVKRLEEKEERDRVRIERRYAKEEVLRVKLAEACRNASRGVGRKGLFKK